jgi:hypothetical protein
MRQTFSVGSFTAAARHRATRLVTVIALVGTAPMTARAEARGATQDAIKEAKELFVEARAAMQQGNLTQALEGFRKSHRRHPSPGTLLNIADCEEQLGLVGSAWLHFHLLTIELPASDDRHALAEERAASLKPRVPWLRIDLSASTPADASVTCDSIAAAKTELGAALPIDPGAHVIVVTARDRQEQRYEVTLVEGTHDRLTVEPGTVVRGRGEPARAAAPTAAMPRAAERARGTSSSAALGSLGWASAGTRGSSR